MRDKDKTKEQLLSELVELRKRVAELEASQVEDKRVEALYAVTQAVSQTLELGEMLNGTLEKVGEVMGTDMGLVYFLDVMENALLLKARRGLTKSAVGRISTVKLGEEEFQKVLEWQEPRIFSSEIFGETTLGLIAKAMQEAQAQSFAVVPFSGKDELRGMMIVASRAQREFSPDDVELLGTLGKQIGIGVESAVRFEEMSRMATIDGLTGLYNHRYFQERLQQEVARSSRYGQECCLIMLDLDHFRIYNDLFGHVLGDEVLKKMGRLLLNCTRREDLVCRYGGAEFAVVLPQTGSSTARGVAERLRQAVEAALLEESTVNDANLTISLGVASFPSDGASPEGLIRRADVALAAAKQRGRNQTCLTSDVLGGTPDMKRTFWEVAEYLEAASANTVYAMAAAVDARDHCTHVHSRNVSNHAVAIGRAIGLPKKKVERLRIAALLHDIGKIGVSDSTIKKPGPLNKDEWEMMKKHSELGATIVGHIPELADCAPAIRHHHEWYDGSGYPHGIKGKDIPVEARIITVAEAYDTMTTPRSYRQAISHEQAVEELRRCSSTQFDPALVLAFINATG